MGTAAIHSCGCRGADRGPADFYSSRLFRPVHSRLQATFGEHAYWDTAQRIRHRAAQPVPHTPHIRTDPTPLVCGRAMGIAAHEAIARDQDVGPEHLLLGLLREAEEPIGTDLPAQSLRERILLGLPDHGPHPIKLLVEGQGLTLGGPQAAVLERGA